MMCEERKIRDREFELELGIERERIRLQVRESNIKRKTVQKYFFF